MVGDQVSPSAGQLRTRAVQVAGALVKLADIESCPVEIEVGVFTYGLPGFESLISKTAVDKKLDPKKVMVCALLRRATGLGEALLSTGPMTLKFTELEISLFGLII